MPFKLTKTTPANLPWGRSVSFNTTSYISTPANAVFNPGNTGAWTLECWFYPLATTAGRIALLGNGGAFGHALQISWGIDTISKFTFAQANGSSATVWGGPSASTYALNTWYHLAVSKDASNNIKCFINGVEEVPLRQTAMTSTIASGNSLLVNSKNDNTGKGNGTSGYTSNVRWIKGTALYTASFTPPTSPLDVITNTSLLACHDTSFKDGSVNNFAITTSGTPSISTATPFVVSTKSVLFNGSNYLSLTGQSLSGANFTIEGWVYFSTFATYTSPHVFNFGTDINNRYVIYRNPTSGKFNLASVNSGTLTLTDGTTTPVTGRWYHVAYVRNGSTNYMYIDGQQDATNSAAVDAGTSYAIGFMQYGSSAADHLNGYISNFRVVKGTALYTASFTPLAEPLTSVASCSLLTCNAPTIVDSSSNNFTITNNGSATVSSVVPFNAVGYGYNFKNVSSTAAKRNFNFSKSAVTLVYLTQKAIFGYGLTAANVSMTNLVSNTGVVATDTTGVGTTRRDLAAARYDADKAIFGYGNTDAGITSITNLVSNTGVVATDTAGVGTSRDSLAAASYGNDKAIFGYGSGPVSITNLVSNIGVVANDTAGVGTARLNLAAAGYGTDKAIFGYGTTNGAASGRVSITNLVSNTGVVASDTTGVGTSRYFIAAAGYGNDKAIFGYGNDGGNLSMTNLVSNTGVVATDTTGVGTARRELAAAGYGIDKAIFGFGYTTSRQSMTNLVSNTGVVATDTTGVGTARRNLAAAGYSLT